jgi:hypothetical protein
MSAAPTLPIFLSASCPDAGKFSADPLVRSAHMPESVLRQYAQSLEREVNKTSAQKKAFTLRRELSVAHKKMLSETSSKADDESASTATTTKSD